MNVKQKSTIGESDGIWGRKKKGRPRVLEVSDLLDDPNEEYRVLGLEKRNGEKNVIRFSCSNSRIYPCYVYDASGSLLRVIKF